MEMREGSPPGGPARAKVGSTGRRGAVTGPRGLEHCWGEAFSCERLCQVSLSAAGGAEEVVKGWKSSAVL